MTMGSLSESVVQKKFETLQSTQENIETVSLWCLHHKDHHSTIVKIWMKCFKTVTSKQRLSLIYLLNDVCQRERHKKYDGFRKSFAAVLKEAITLIGSDEIRSNVERIVDIWKERDIFDANFVSELKKLLHHNGNTSDSYSDNNNTPKEEPPVIKDKRVAEFKSDVLISELERMKNEKQIMQRAQSLLPTVPFHADGNVKSYLKDRQEGIKYVREIEFAHKKLSDFVDDLERHLQGQSRLIGQLEHAKLFYEIQLTEAGVVETAYRKFGAGVQRVKQELDKMKSSGLYPAEEDSPPANAPSPGPNDDPFAQGVEAVAASKHKPTDIEPIDMDLEEDSIHAATTSRSLATLDGISVATNRTFLPSNIASLTSTNGTISTEPSSKMPKLFDTPHQQQQQASGWPHQFQHHNIVNQNLQQTATTPNMLISHHGTNVASKHGSQQQQQQQQQHPGLAFDYNHSMSTKSTMLPAIVPTATNQSVPPAPTVRNVPPPVVVLPPPPPPMPMHQGVPVAPGMPHDLLKPPIPIDMTSPPPRFPTTFGGGPPAVPLPPPAGTVPYGANPPPNQYSPPIIPNVVHVSRFGPPSVKEQRPMDKNEPREYPAASGHHVTRGGINQSNLTVLSGGGDGGGSGGGSGGGEKVANNVPDPRYRNVVNPTGGAAGTTENQRTFWPPGGASQQQARFMRPPPPPPPPPPPVHHHGGTYQERQRFQHQQQPSSWSQQGM